MFCCINCFSDTEIKAIIEGNNKLGNCDFCGKTNTYVEEIGSSSSIVEDFNSILDVYTPISVLPDNFPKVKTDLIKNILYNEWHIFNNLKPEKIYELVTSICAERYKLQPELFDSPVGIFESQNKDYLEENSILKNNRWEDFVEGIKHKNRFHSSYINLNKLLVFIQCAAKLYLKDKVFYRSRICEDEIGYKCSEMGPPPNNKAKGGRVNPTGISILYLSDSKETTFYEIRAGVYDLVTTGSFKLQKNINVINFAGIDKISPFIGNNAGFDPTQYAINIEHLKMLSQEIAKPIRNDNILDYLPTQYICDFIRSEGYDGIEYLSTMSKKGYNLAVFNPKLFKCTETSVYDVKSISYEFKQL